MNRLILPIAISFVCFAACTKTADNTSPAAKLLIAQPWVLQYTDSFSQDNNHAVVVFHIPAQSCAQQESLTFMKGFVFQQKLVCGQPLAKVLPGEWSMDGDSVLFYGLKIDSAAGLGLAYIQKISADTMILTQAHSYDTSIYHRPIFVSDVYSH